ncbi:MAG TPA: BlaI/MecI/CopY family transcriptional regulator [Streptosporangiaceae bacterium]
MRHEDHGQPAAASSRRAAGELEAAALAVLQAADSALIPAEVRERLTGPLAYSTVVTILSRLHAKGVLSRVRAGRSYAYAPVADEPGLAARRMRGVLEAEDDRETVLARFVSGLSPADEKLLRRMLGEAADTADAAHTSDADPDR